jgi:AraC-like DNA-binding protein
MPDNPTDPIQDMEAVLKQHERAWGLSLVLKGWSTRWLDGSGELLISRQRVQHRLPYCRAQKARAIAACVVDCERGISARCPAGPRGGWSRCHADLHELLVPVPDGSGEFDAVLSIGGWPEPGPTTAQRQSAEACAQALQAYLSEWQRRYQCYRSEQQHGLLEQVRSRIDAHLHEDCSLAGIAAELHYSPAWLSRLIRRHGGSSFTQMRETRRLAHACQLLHRSERSIERIAQQSGFHNVAYFYSIFKRRFGMTPQAWRVRRQAEGGTA